MSREIRSELGGWGIGMPFKTTSLALSAYLWHGPSALVRFNEVLLCG